MRTDDGGNLSFLQLRVVKESTEEEIKAEKEAKRLEIEAKTDKFIAMLKNMTEVPEEQKAVPE